MKPSNNPHHQNNNVFFLIVSKYFHFLQSIAFPYKNYLKGEGGTIIFPYMYIYIPHIFYLYTNKEGKNGR